MRCTPCLLLALLLACWPASGEAGGEACPNRPEIVVVPAAADLATICAAAGQALEFLARYDLSPRRTILFNIVETTLVSGLSAAFGRYDTSSEVVELMSYRAILAQEHHPRIYGEPFDEAHYAGVIAHEAAHAVVHQNLVRKSVSAVAQEYLAYATQLAVLSADRRSAVIEAMGVGPWEPGDAISDVYMAMAPGRFAVKAYLHLTTTPQPKKFIQYLMQANWSSIYVP